MIRTFINDATRKQNIVSIKSKGESAIYQMVESSLNELKEFQYLLVFMFQEVVSEELAQLMYDKLIGMGQEVREKVLKEVVDRYMVFAHLGYVFVVKNYLDTYSC